MSVQGRLEPEACGAYRVLLLIEQVDKEEPGLMIIHIYPMGPSQEAQTATLVAVARTELDGTGQLERLIPMYRERLQALFEQPQLENGRELQPWTPEALEYILRKGLSRANVVGIQQ